MSAEAEEALKRMTSGCADSKAVYAEIVAHAKRLYGDYAHVYVDFGDYQRTERLIISDTRHYPGGSNTACRVQAPTFVSALACLERLK